MTREERVTGHILVVDDHGVGGVDDLEPHRVAGREHADGDDECGECRAAAAAFGRTHGGMRHEASEVGDNPIMGMCRGSATGARATFAQAARSD